MTLRRRTRPVIGQSQHWMRVAQLRAPIRELPVALTSREPVSLPGCEIRILNHRYRRRARALPDAAPIEPGQLFEHHIKRPAVDDDVMGEQQQFVLVICELKQGRPEQRPVHEIERPGEFGPPQLGGMLGTVARGI